MFFNQKTKQSIINAPQWLLHQFLSITKRDRESRGKTQTLTQTLILASSTKPNKTREGKRAKEKKTKKNHKREPFFTSCERKFNFSWFQFLSHVCTFKCNPCWVHKAKPAFTDFTKGEREIFSRGLFKGFLNCLDIQSTLHQLQISSAQGCMLRYSRMRET